MNTFLSCTCIGYRIILSIHIVMDRIFFISKIELAPLHICTLFSIIYHVSFMITLLPRKNNATTPDEASVFFLNAYQIIVLLRGCPLFCGFNYWLRLYYNVIRTTNGLSHYTLYICQWIMLTQNSKIQSSKCFYFLYRYLVGTIWTIGEF